MDEQGGNKQTLTDDAIYIADMDIADRDIADVDVVDKKKADMDNGVLPENVWDIPGLLAMNKKKGREYDADIDDSDSAESLDSTGKRKSFRRLIKRFAEKTSMQGVPYINNAKLVVAKIIWSLLLICALVLLGFHLWFLFTQYYDWPKQTKVELGFNNLRFPDITICNANPIHKGKFEQLTGVKQLKKLIADLNPRNLVPDQFDDNYNPLDEPNNEAPQPGGNIASLGTTQQNNVPQGTNPQNNVPQGTIPPNNVPQVTTPQNNAPQATSPQNNAPQVTTPQNNVPQGTNSKSQGTTTAPQNQNSNSTNDQSTGVPKTSRRSTTGRTPPSGSPPSGSPPPQVRKRRFVQQLEGLNLTEYSDDFDRNLQDDFELVENEFDEPLSTSTSIRELYEELYMDLPKNERAEIGHNITDMLLDCTFNGRVCSTRQFELHQTSEYGNCWILSSNKFTVQNSGPSGGLSIVLYLESQEYLMGLTTGYGLRIQIHEPGTIPYPSEEGLFIPSSMETDIGLKMVYIDRISGNYGTCDEGVGFDTSYRKKYTRRACQRICEMFQVINSCDCFADEHEEIARQANDSLRPCRSTKEKNCEIREVRKFDMKTSDCNCPNPCTEIQYQRSISSRQWPNDDYARVLLQSICDDDKQVCATLRNNINDQRILNNNFLKLNIYYEDLNFQNITEEPEITLSQFLSDVGGAVGLWIGLSILSVCEVIQLLVELCDYTVHRTLKRRRREKQRESRRKEGLSNNDKHSNDSDKKSKPNSEKRWPHTSFNVKDSPRSTPRLMRPDVKPINGISPHSDRRSNHLKELRGYDSDNSRRGSHDKHMHSKDIGGRGSRYDEDYFRRNYMMGY